MARQGDIQVPAPDAGSLDFVERLYFDWLRNPGSVDEGWRRYFEALGAVEGAGPAPEGFPRRRADGHATAAELEAFQARVDRMVQAYREHGHLLALLDPLGLERRASTLPAFGLSEFGLSEADLDRPVAGGDPERPATTTLRQLRARLEETYCRTLGVELAHLHDRELRRWLERRMERTGNRLTLAPEVRKKLLRKLTEAELFEQFAGTRFLGAKRFSLEGAESLVALFELVIDRAIGHGVRNLVIGMAHRGRLNLLANVLGKPLAEIFAEFRDQGIIDGGGGGDVKYHLGYSADRDSPDGGLHLSLAFNPSHLEWIDTVVQGRVRAKQDRWRDFDRRRSMPILVHGDAAFAGQGVVAESLTMSELAAYTVGGTLHVVVNNQVGFTTSPRDARSTTYATGLATMLDVPIFHVNGEDLESVAQAVLLAVDFRQRYHRDAIIDLWCYRKHGHNEGDEPSFTQPLMVRAIVEKEPVRAVYARALAEAGVLSPGEAEAMAGEVRARLEEAHAASAALAVQPGRPEPGSVWGRYRGGPIGPGEPETAVPLDVLRHVGRHLSEIPRGFHAHPKIAKIMEGRAEMAAGKRPLDWGMAEALALGSLAWQGTRVRLVGQDTRRGTFSHRHAVLHDQENGAEYQALSHLREGQGAVEIRDSLLSEAGALGFEYGYSLEMPEALVIWEAQFGDFVNAAQVIVDQFLCASETKWNRLSGLTLLLPHGLEGQGPEHSSARLARFLSLSVEDNWQVMNLTTPAQLFHALRRQVLAPWRKPLVVMSPKSLLRHPQAVSPLGELAAGRLHPVLADDGGTPPGEIGRVLLCSGKIYYELAAERAAQQARQVALVRLEQLFPLREAEVLRAVSRYPASVELLWVQEEPRNMGGWSHVRQALAKTLPRLGESCLARPPSPSPASGSATRHKLEQQALVREAIGPPRR
ncbi:MAG TPA: 2-oxoglutarate dehydrogenase E1 component [Anaeromyxobacteraceae bacterium]|nr:2-oxoglutarate dehydrogenase E1 component [Anaeromyxobacteraceae bacterium]